MSVSIIANTVAMTKNLTNPLAATGGTAPYTWSVRSGGISGSINSSTGVYTSPDAFGVETIQVKDNVGAVAYKKIFVMNQLQLVCDIIRNELGLANDQVYVYNQKFIVPNDSRMYVSVAVLSLKSFGNSRPVVGSVDDLNVVQSVNMQGTLDIDIMSRSEDALNRKEEVLMSLNSMYSESQQELNSFYIAPLTTAFVNLSELDGSAIPYRFRLGVNIQYMISKTKPVSFFDDFADPSLATNT